MASLRRKLIVYEGSRPTKQREGEDDELLTFDAFAAMMRGRAWISRVRAYREAELIGSQGWLMRRPLLTVTALRLLSRGPCWVQDDAGVRTRVDVRLILWRIRRFVFDALQLPFVLRSIRRQIHDLQAGVPTPHSGSPKDGVPIYLRTDLSFSMQVGGSITHTAGVVTHLGDFFREPLVFSPMPNPLVPEQIPWFRILPDARYWDFAGIPALLFSRSACTQVIARLGTSHAAFVYQRYSMNSYAAVLLARKLAVPLVTEYNGSEVWASRQWGRGLARQRLSRCIEILNVRNADVVVTVSEPLRRELLEIGIEDRRILVNPNGVDTQFFRPDIDASALRRSLGLDRKLVVGFLGTFGVWHGSEVLVQAFADLLRATPELRERLHLLMVGDGIRRPAAMRLAEETGIATHCTFTGLVPQPDGPRWLACCDILVTPQVPNQDGSEFFGSPTKLFEYMAMGRPVIASRLGQIGQVLEHRRTAWLVEPGDVATLSQAIGMLAESEILRTELGRAARQVAVQEYSWRGHVERIALAIQRVCQ